MELLKELSIKTNRIYTDYALYTLPVRMPKSSKALKQLFGIQTDGGMISARKYFNDLEVY